MVYDTQPRPRDILFIKRMRSRLRKGKTPINLIVGDTRSGKTLYAIQAAEELQPDFDVREQLVTKIEDFANVYSRHTQKVIILDEVETTLDPHKSAEIQQRCYSHIVSSQAVRQNMVFLILPFACDIGKAHKAHVDTIIDIIGHHKKHGAIAKFYKTLKWRADPNESKVKLMHIETVTGIPLPSKRNLDIYLNEKQMQDKDEILQEELEEIRFAKEKKLARRMYYNNKTLRGEQVKPTLYKI